MSSVPAEAREQTKFQILIDMRLLVKYSLKILQNNKCFKAFPSGNAQEDIANPPQPELVNLLRMTIIEAYQSAYSANETPFTKDNYRHRRQLQDKSAAKLNEMLALVEMSVPVFHISIQRFGKWSAWIVCIRNRVQAWKESDYKRYRRM